MLSLERINKAKVMTLKVFNAPEDNVQTDDWIGMLTDKVKYLLEHDFNALVNILYKIDVSEAHVKMCFGKANDEIAIGLAELIWERQLQKQSNR